jgi:hypothetical protein
LKRPGAVVRLGLAAVSLGFCAAGFVSCSGDGEGLNEAGDPISAVNVAIIGPAKDNTLYEFAAGTISNGSGQHFFAGKTGAGSIRRGLIAFDIAGSIPAGSRVTSATLTLHLSREPVAGGPESIELHQVLADWGEGTSDAPANEGGGTTATPGDVTWIHTFSDTGFWSSPGGDFSPTASDSQTVDAIGFYTWSGAGLVADVQSWLDNPQDNFGWVVIGNESVPLSAKRFDARENTETSFRPELSVGYEAGP